MSKDEFYIGWKDDMPVSTRKFLRNTLLSLTVLIPAIITFVLAGQKPFNDHVFEFGTATEITGIYISEPFPMIQITKDKPENINESVLLVGFGKFGARSIMDEIEESAGSLELKEITISGTMIYGDGLALLELTNQTGSYISASGNYRQPLVNEHINESIEVTGEILDSKCYFGVMKPGEGKIHKSCAIRCISGGIPPVIRVWQQASKSYDYHLLTGLNGEEISAELLQYVGEKISISGRPYQQLGWNVLEIDANQIQRTLAIND
jgi:hypothetical protein